MPTAFKIECKKHALKQRVDGTWELALTCHADDMALAVLQAPMGTQWIAAFAEYSGKEEPEAEQPKEKGWVKPKRTFQDMPRSQQAGMLCQEDDFIRWVQMDTPGEAAANIREFCGVKSRADLDADEKAAAIWDDLAKRYYEAMGLRL